MLITDMMTNATTMFVYKSMDLSKTYIHLVGLDYHLLIDIEPGNTLLLPDIIEHVDDYKIKRIADEEIQHHDSYIGVMLNWIYDEMVD